MTGSPMFYLLLLFLFPLCAELSLRDNFRSAKPGDYVVAQFARTDTLLRVVSIQDDQIRMEEVSAPSYLKFPSWQEWLHNGAEGNSSWVTFVINLKTGELKDFYSLSRGCFLQVAESENFLSTLLALEFEKIPREKMKMGGTKRIWQPTLYFNSQAIEGVFFEAYKTKWPADDSDLSGKTIVVYLPEKGSGYPDYFPYWLEISGGLTKAKVRIIDTGHGLTSPLDSYLQNKH